MSKERNLKELFLSCFKPSKVYKEKAKLVGNKTLQNRYVLYLKVESINKEHCIELSEKDYFYYLKKYKKDGYINVLIEIYSNSYRLKLE